MLAIAVALSVSLSGTQASDVKAFRDAFALRKSEYPTEKPDAAVMKAMDILIAKLRKETNGNTTGEEIVTILNPFARAVSGEEVFATSYASLSGAISRGFGKVAIGVRMGSASRLRVFNAATGQPVPVPKELDWQYRYEMSPNVLPGGKIVIDSPGIQDAGVRYGYRVSVLNPGPNGLVLTKQFSGAWVLEDQAESHFGLDGTTLTLSTIEDPRSFFTSSPTKLFVSVMTYDLSGPAPRLLKTDRQEPMLRAVDLWMSNAMKSPQTALEKAFQASYGKKGQMLDGWGTVDEGTTTSVTIRLEDTKYTFSVEKKSGAYRVVGFTDK